MVTATDVDGEYVCVRCGRVFGSVEVAGIEKTHSYWASRIEQRSTRVSRYAHKVVSILNLPDYALATIIRVAEELVRSKVTQKHALLFATLYACREYNIPRLLGNILDAMRRIYGTEIAKSSASLLRILNKIAKKAYALGYEIGSPDKYYYLKAYLAKIQNLMTSEISSEYYECLRNRAFRALERFERGDASHAARNAIFHSVPRTLRYKIERVLIGDLDV